MFKHFSKCFVVWSVVVSVLFNSNQGLVFAADLPPFLQTALQNEIAPHWERGDAVGALEKLAGVLPRMNDAQLAEMDQWLAEKSLPSVAAMLVDTRLAMVQQNLNRQMPRLGARELALVLPEIGKRIEAVVAECRDHRAMARPLPNPAAWPEYEKLLYELRMLGQQVDGAVRLAQFERDLTKAGTRRKAGDVPATESASRLEQLEKLHAAVDEQQLGLRLQRFDRAVNALQQAGGFKEQLQAAALVDEDGEWLSAVLKLNAKNKREYALPELNRDGLQDDLAAQLETARDTQGELLQKSRLFLLGVQWWLRGRYGRGPEGFGLLKSELALASPQLQMALFMPPETPTPKDSSSQEESVPQFDRRHHYIWMFEYRKVTQSTQQRATTTGETVAHNRPDIPVWAHQTTTEWTILTKSLTASDGRQVARLVGFLEYQNALGCLDSLVRMSSPEEVTVYDELIRERPELAVYTNLSRRCTTGPSSLNEPVAAGATYEQRGLRWVTALARVELAAMLAAFTSLPKPFENVNAGPFDLEQYRELLLDGARCHYWALRNDPALPAVLRDASLGQPLLCYSRRVGLARSMLAAASQSDQFALEQYQELKAWHDSLNNLDSRFHTIIAVSLQSPTVIKDHEYFTVGGLHPSVKAGIKFTNWPFDQSWPGFHLDMIRVSGQIK